MRDALPGVAAVLLLGLGLRRFLFGLFCRFRLILLALAEFLFLLRGRLGAGFLGGIPLCRVALCSLVIGRCGRGGRSGGCRQNVAGHRPRFRIRGAGVLRIDDLARGVYAFVDLRLRARCGEKCDGKQRDSKHDEFPLDG